MKSITWIAGPALLLALVACAPGADEAAEAEDPGAVVAVLDGEEIREADLHEWMRDDLFEHATRDKGASALYELESDALERMIQQRLLEAETGRRGVEIAALHDEIIASVEISEDEIAAFYEANRGRIGDASLGELSSQIHAYLLEQEQARVWGEFVDGLADAAELSIALSPPRLAVEAVGPGLGPEDAAVTIVEFSDFNCPYCQRVTPTLKALRERYPEQVRIVFRHFPLDRIHPRARPIAEASVCAGAQDAFWPFHDKVFENGTPMADEAIADAARGLGLDMGAFAACLSDAGTAARVQRDVDAGTQAGVTGTPAFFVNGIPLSGARGLEDFVELIESELAGDGDVR